MVEPKIVTFYSYKGGVGRTMSLANVAFLAAFNNIRVLVMDWDMEAPGLAYYFRGLHDGAEAKKLKDTRGLLDLCWEWHDAARSAKSPAQIQTLVDSAQSGRMFEECTRELIGPGTFDETITLDYISAGGMTIGEDKISYEDALSRFSWVDFFEQSAGGAMLESLKNWAKSNYELILIDSRTGFADVAGICTMQLPDEVALCFVLNRQNIDGISRVAGAIREQREEKVRLRAVPMRVVRGESSEGSDAKARASNELVRVGGFSPITIQEDIKNLAISSYDEVPFYETLAPFTATDALFDPLTLNYARLASHLVGRELQVPRLDPDSVALVKNRLLPRHATVEFLQTLSNGEPERAIVELQHLLESAFEAVMSDEVLEPQYVKALVDAADKVSLMSEDLVETAPLRAMSLDLVRAVASTDMEQWFTFFLEKLGEAVEFYGYTMESDSQLALLEEIDILLSTSATINLKIKRLEYRRKAAWIYTERKDSNSAMRTVGEIITIRKSVSNDKLAKDQHDELIICDVEVHRIKADTAFVKDDYPSAIAELRQALQLIENIKTQSPHLAPRILFSIHLKFTEIPPGIISDKEIGDHALAAVINSPSIQRVAIRFNQLVDAILRAGHNDFLVLLFCEAIIGSDTKAKPYLSNYFGRYPALAEIFFKSVRELISVVSRAEDRPRALKVCEFFAETSSMVLRSLLRRRRTVNDKQAELLDYEFDLLTTLFDRVGVHIERHSSELESRFMLSSHRHGGVQDEEL